MDTVSIHGTINPPHIGFLNAIIDAHEGLASVRTLDAKAGLLEFWVAPDRVAEFREIVAELADEVGLVLESD